MDYKEDYIRAGIALGFQLIAGTLNLIKIDDEGFVSIYVPYEDLVKSDFDMGLEVTGKRIEQLSKVVKMPPEFFKSMVEIFGVKII